MKGDGTSDTTRGEEKRREEKRREERVRRRDRREHVLRRAGEMTGYREYRGVGLISEA